MYLYISNMCIYNLGTMYMYMSVLIYELDTFQMDGSM